MKRWAFRLALAAVLGLLLAACGDEDLPRTAFDSEPTEGAEPAEDESAEGADEEEPAAGDDEERSEPETLATADDASGASSVRVWVVRDYDGDLWLESERRDLAEPTEGVARAAMTELLTKPTKHPDLRPPAGTDAELLGVAISDGVLTVDVSEAIHDAATGAAGEEAFQQALAHTGAQFDSVDAVTLDVEGSPVDELWGHIDWSEPVAPQDEALGFIDVVEPGWLDHHDVDEPLTVAGTSLTFEATVPLTLVDPDGEIVEETFATAEQPDVGLRGPFELTFDAVPDEPGQWTIIAEEPDPSGGEAEREPYQVEVRIEVE